MLLQPRTTFSHFDIGKPQISCHAGHSLGVNFVLIGQKSLKQTVSAQSIDEAGNSGRKALDRGYRVRVKEILPCSSYAQAMSNVLKGFRFLQRLEMITH